MSNSTVPKRIHLLSSGGEPRTEEGTTGAAITPGMLLKKNAAGSYIPHNVAGGASERAYALEDALQGKTIDDHYASGTRLSFVLADDGDVIYGLLAAGEEVTEADYLSSNGDGTLKRATGTDKVVAAPCESVDNADTFEDSARDPLRIRVRII